MKGPGPDLLHTSAVATRWPFFGLAIFVVLVAFGLTLIAQTWEGTQKTLAQLRAAESDNLTWNLTQLEVDYQALVESLILAQIPPANTVDALAKVRLRFDILFSRIAVLQSSSMAAQLSMHGASSDVAARLAMALQGSLHAIDGDDATLSLFIPQILQSLRELQGPIRHFSVRGVQAVDAATAQRRGALAEATREFARISILMIAFIALVAVFVFSLASALRRKTEALTIMGKNLATIQDVAFDAIIVIDAKGLIRSLNVSAERMFGMHRASAIGQELPALLMREPASNWLREGLNEYLTTGASSLIGKLLALHMHDALGGNVPVEGAFMAGTDVDGSRFIVAVLRDVRERFEAEAEISRALVAAQIGEETKRRVIAVLGHELRTALNGVIGSINLLASTGLGKTQRHSLLKSAEISAQDALRIANNALESASLEASGSQSADTDHYNLNAVIERIASQHADMAAYHGTRLKIAIDPSADRPISGDEHLISLATTHLLNNAIRFTRNGNVEIAAQLIHVPEHGAIVEIRVSDNGCGIALSEQRRIFEDFETLNDDNSRSIGGAGLGLGIVARAVKLLNGQVSVKSERHKGSEFCIRYPAIPANPIPVRVTAMQRDPSESLAVLVVDDNAINRQVLCATLQLLGIAADEARDGQETVDMARRFAYDFIFMDVAMPRLDGFEATRQIRLSGPSRCAVIVGLTAHIRPEDRYRLIDAGMQEVMLKPLTQSALERIIGRTPNAVALVETENDTLVTLVQSLGETRVRQLVDQFALEAAGLLDAPLLDGATRAHSIAGAAALFGFDTLRTCFLTLEVQFQTGDEGLETTIAETRQILTQSLRSSDQLITWSENGSAGD